MIRQDFMRLGAALGKPRASGDDPLQELPR